MQVSSAEEIPSQIVHDYTKDYNGHSMQQTPFQKLTILISSSDNYFVLSLFFKKSRYFMLNSKFNVV